MEVDDIRIEMLTRGESVRYLGQMIAFPATGDDRNQESNQGWATFHKYWQELTSKNYMLNHQLRLFDAAITPTICQA